MVLTEGEQTAIDGMNVGAEMIERVLVLELGYLQHQGIATQVIYDPRLEG